MSETAFYGWYEDDTQPNDQPTYNPPFDAPCLLCGNGMSLDDIRTISMMWAEGYARRSYFYRTHRTCHEAAADSLRKSLDDIVWGMVERNGD